MFNYIVTNENLKEIELNTFIQQLLKLFILMRDFNSHKILYSRADKRQNNKKNKHKTYIYSITNLHPVMGIYSNKDLTLSDPWLPNMGWHLWQWPLPNHNQEQQTNTHAGTLKKLAGYYLKNCQIRLISEENKSNKDISNEDHSLYKKYCYLLQDNSLPRLKLKSSKYARLWFDNECKNV